MGDAEFVCQDVLGFSPAGDEVLEEVEVLRVVVLLDDPGEGDYISFVVLFCLFGYQTDFQFVSIGFNQAFGFREFHVISLELNSEGLRWLSGGFAEAFGVQTEGFHEV